MKQTTVWAMTMAVALLLLSGCSHEFRGENIPRTGELSSSVRFILKIPIDDAVLFESMRAIQTTSEMSIEQIDIYQFVNDNGTFVLEDYYLNQSFRPVGDGASMTLNVKSTGLKHFVMVANNKGTGVVKSLFQPRVGMSLDAFKKQVTESADGVLLTTPLLMVGERDVEVKEEGTDHQSVELTRVMARLDIKNYDSNLTLKRVRLDNVQDRSYLMHVGTLADPQNVAGAKRINLPEVTLPLVATSLSEDPSVAMEVVPERMDASGTVIVEKAHQHYKHVYYPYVSDAVTDKALAPVLIIEGTRFKGDPVREHDVVYTKVLQVDGESDYLGFERNHRYTVAIESGADGGEAEIKLYVNEWNLVNLPIEEVEVMAPTVGSIIEYDGWSEYLAYIEGVSITCSSKIFSGIYLSRLSFYLNRNTDWMISLDGINEVTENQITSWLRVEKDIQVEVVDYLGNTRPATGFDNTFVLCFTEDNETGEDRSVTVVLISKADPSKHSTFTITQSAKERLD